VALYEGARWSVEDPAPEAVHLHMPIETLSADASGWPDRARSTS
jgi:hypothetical protein